MYQHINVNRSVSKLEKNYLHQNGDEFQTNQELIGNQFGDIGITTAILEASFI